MYRCSECGQLRLLESTVTVVFLCRGDTGALEIRIGCGCMMQHGHHQIQGFVLGA